MKNECHIVRDLLPSYIDQLCSEESTQFIEQHLAQCDACSQIFRRMKEEVEQADLFDTQARVQQKKPFEKVSNFFKAQSGFVKFLKSAFWLSLVLTLVFAAVSLNDLSEWNDNKQEELRVDQEQEAIMEKAFSAISMENAPEETAILAVVHQYQNQLQHLAVFQAEEANIKNSWLEGPTNTFPIDYRKASLVVGEKGGISETIVPSDYDIGTVVMAKGDWVVQFEYKESYLKTVESAFQTKHYAPALWDIFALPFVLLVLTLFIFASWSYQRRILKPISSVLS